MGMLVRDGRVHFGLDFGRYVEQMVQPRARQMGVELRPEVAGEPVPARVNHNRWVVACPDCGVCAFVWLDCPALMCLNCFNGTVGYRFRPVATPLAWWEIEAALRVRPVPQNRNWLPEETVADLRRENAEHGLPETEEVGDGLGNAA